MEILSPVDVWRFFGRCLEIFVIFGDFCNCLEIFVIVWRFFVIIWRFVGRCLEILW